MLFLLAVNCLVSLQLPLGSAALAASRAHKRLLTRVNSVVNVEVVLAREKFQANGAFVRIGFVVVLFLMKVKAASTDEPLIANSANKFLLSFFRI